MNDFLDIFKFFSGILAGIVSLVLVVICIVCSLEYMACPKGAKMYNTEYEFIMGVCYFKYNDKWLSAEKYKQVVLVNALDMSDESKMIMIKDIDK